MACSPLELAQTVARTLHASAHQVYYVGGYVRDRLLGRPVTDIDLCTDAPPARLMELFPGAPQVGAHFGVVLVRRDGAEVQVATFRSDHAYGDGRRPEAVSFETDARQDVTRRDFTINALLEDPFSGEIVDYTGGQADLDARLVRAIGDARQRFAEDHLRMLRAVRFAAGLGFEIEAGTMAAMKEMAPSIKRIAPERAREELTRILTEGAAKRGCELLDEVGLMHALLPEVERLKGVPQPPDYHPEGDVWIHTLLVLEAVGKCTPELGWAALLHDIGKPSTMKVADRIRFHGHGEVGARMARAILGRLRASNELIDAVTSHVGAHMRFKDAPNMGEAAFRRFLRLPRFDELLALHQADRLGSRMDVETFELVQRRRAALTAADIRPRPLVGGRALMAMGYREGPEIGGILKAQEEEQLEGRLKTRDEAIEWVRRKFPLDAD